jgi:hypothetical protein
LRYGLLVAFSLLSWPVIAGEVDRGSYSVYQGDRAIGSEVFLFATHGDTLVIQSEVHQMLPRSSSSDTLEKSMTLVVGALDYDLWSYRSYQSLRGQTIKRRLTLDDTLFTSYRETGVLGAGERLIRPPGRLFVIDPQFFVLFDIMCRNLHGRSFEKRPLSILLLGARDTVLQVEATHLGTETIRWGSRPIQARKLSFTDSTSEFFAWVHPNGHMLRLKQPASGLLVEREPPASKRGPKARRSG